MSAPLPPRLSSWQLSASPTGFKLIFGSVGGFQDEAADVPPTDTTTLLLFPSRSGALVNETVERYGAKKTRHDVGGLQPGTQYTLHVVFTNAGGASAASLQFTTPLTLDPPPHTTLGCFSTTPAYDDVRGTLAGNRFSYSGLQPGTRYTLHVVFTNAGGASAASLQFTTPLTLDPPPFTTLGCFNTTPAYDDVRAAVLDFDSAPCGTSARARGYRYFGDGRKAGGSPVCLASNALDALTASGPLGPAAANCTSQSTLDSVVSVSDLGAVDRVPPAVPAGYRAAASLCVHHPTILDACSSS
eukprot:tig00021518_g22025.t1